ncbi:MAG: RNA polymerase sigma factor [Gemmataceae bacterium]|nr:RNA polymerase sigma factor [Gemmataceae bacterium]MCI0742460.1 RNA polymerase sigma factor [Gemmataceae bacterium]
MRHLEPLHGPLETYCRRFVHDVNAIADVLQSAVANAFADFHLYVEGTNFRAWMFRYLHLEILNWNRKSKRDRTAELPSDLSVEDAWQLALDEPLVKVLMDDPEAVLDQCADALAGAVRALPALEQSAFLLQAIGEFKYREIAGILQVPIGTVMSLLSRCRIRLRQHLVKFGEEHGLLKPQSPS